MNLNLRRELNRTLTWEEVDDNWEAIREAVDELDTRYTLPLWLLGDETEDVNVWLGDLVIEEDELTLHGLFSKNNELSSSISIGNPSNDTAFVSIASSTDDNVSLIFVSNHPLNHGVLMTAESYSPFMLHELFVGRHQISMSANETTLWRGFHDPLDGKAKMGFFGPASEQLEISQYTTDASVTELQDILIAFGLARDER